MSNGEQVKQVDGRNTNGMEIKKIKPYRNKRYLRFVAAHPCHICCTEDETIVAHHEGSGVMGSKVSDLRTIPLCVDCHEEVHKIGRGIWSFYMNPQDKMLELINEWLC